ncbi:MAG: hypothetical protein H6559_14665 [Lewinellaceae bacterium]|nr:hypothetical protein [Lewinellaceae bacterium]
MRGIVVVIYRGKGNSGAVAPVFPKVKQNKDKCRNTAAIAEKNRPGRRCPPTAGISGRKIRREWQKRLASQNKKAIFAAVKNPSLDFKVSGYGLIYIILTWQ